jgi:hypothetical protein
VVALDEPAVVVDDELLELQAANPKATSTNNMPARVVRRITVDLPGRWGTTRAGAAPTRDLRTP